MRLNRNIRIGAAIVALCLLLLGLIKIAGSLRGSSEPPASLASNAGGGNQAAAAPTPALVSASMVAKARADIPERSIVTPEMLVMVPASPGANNAAFVTNMQDQAVGYVTARPITANATVRRADLLGHISDVGIAGALLPGRRAMIIPISNKATLHELVRIGDRVDIMASFDQQESRVVAEDVRVLAVDVFGSDYPQVKIAMRGDYKASARSLSVAASPSLGSSAPSGAPANPDAPPGQRPAADATATPEPTAANGPPPTRPEAALTIEVTPQQATDIGLTQSAGQNLDFLLRARSEPRLATATGADGITLASGTTGAGTTRSAAFSTRDRVAPYSTRLKRAGAASAPRNSPAREASTIRRNRPSNDSDLPKQGYGSSGITGIPDPDINRVPPANLDGATRSVPAPPSTYDIPVYGDGKLVRTDTVRRPQQ